ncbi:hypothetical protein KOW79_018744 [Hemibagrus wyckioides]|uniref:Uncharacterized protein n=1 Tax=Hemibagrus wyckioides TaxID=337641 RepID=A0A9D3N884_9TELE|nr:hypothetical protein KOW79_018744 [Hemibagrus wyckioides]
MKQDAKPAVITYGMWDQVRVDHGKEFYLTLFMQEMLSHHRFNQERLPYLQTSSTREKAYQITLQNLGVNEELHQNSCHIHLELQTFTDSM